MKKNTLTLLTIKLVFVLSFFSTSLSAQEVLRILAIGNSFSEDAVESYLSPIAQADGVDVVIGNMYIGGCSLETHWNNASTNAPAYSYRKIVGGVLTTTANQTLLTAITDENWDIITIQQVSQNSGQIDTYFPYITNLLLAAKDNATNPNVKFALHQTWAYAANSTHSGFANYNNDQNQMYLAIVETVNNVADQTQIDMIIPAGTAIQNGRTSYIGDNFCRDGYHLDLLIGRYTASCTWYEKLTGRAVIGNSFIPTGMSELEATIAQNAAHYAVEQPSEVTSLAHFTLPEGVELTKPVSIDFGSTPSATPWNNLSSFTEGSGINSLIDSENNFTTVSITVNDSFGGINNEGPNSTTTTQDLPESATRDSFWGNASGVFAGQSQVTGGFLISGLTTTQKYDFDMFAGRKNVSDNRETYFTVTGKNEQTSLVNASNNTTSITSASNIMPTDDGTVTIKLGAGSNNNNSYKFFYINSLTIKLSESTGIESGNQLTYQLYPNPVKSVAFLESTQAIQNIDVFDISGKKVFNDNKVSSNKRELNLSDLAAGYYLMRVNDTSIPMIKVD